MGAIIRIVFGIAILVGAWILKGKATPDPVAEEVTLSLMGTTVSPSSLNLAALAFGLIGFGMIVIGIVALAKRR